MKIIHAVDSSIQNFHGISTYINELIKCSESKGDEVMVLCNNPIGNKNLRPIENKAIIKTFKSLKVPGKPKFQMTITTGISKTIDDFNPDLIWIHTIGTICTKVAKIAKGKYKVVYTKHCFDGELWCLYLNVPKPFQWIFKGVANKFEEKIADACSFIVYHIQDISKVEHKSYFNKFISFNPPIQSSFYENRTEKSLDTNNLTLGFCGRCELDKGIEDTYLGLQLFKEKHPEINLTFYLIGDGPVAKTLPAKYNFLTTIVTGYTNNVIPYLDKLDGFILSSKHETISLSSLEAYSRGIPIFSLPIGYLSESDAIENFYLFENNEQLVHLLEQVFIIEKKSRKIPSGNVLNKLTISYPELLAEVIGKVF
jgi:glycosyltransferase involved in cell wall biosynthesis